MRPLSFTCISVFVLAEKQGSYPTSKAVPNEGITVFTSRNSCIQEPRTIGYGITRDHCKSRYNHGNDETSLYLLYNSFSLYQHINHNHAYRFSIQTPSNTQEQLPNHSEITGWAHDPPQEKAWVAVTNKRTFFSGIS